MPTLCVSVLCGMNYEIPICIRYLSLAWPKKNKSIVLGTYYGRTPLCDLLPLWVFNYLLRNLGDTLNHDPTCSMPTSRSGTL